MRSVTSRPKSPVAPSPPPETRPSPEVDAGSSQPALELLVVTPGPTASASSTERFLERLRELGVALRRSSDVEQARRDVDRHPPDALLLWQDDTDPGAWRARIDELAPEPELPLAVVAPSPRTVPHFDRLGIDEILCPGISDAELRALIGRLERARDLSHQVSRLRRELRESGRLGPLLGVSAAMQRVFDLIERVAPTEVTVLITGESGTGKDLVAQTIHGLSPRRKGVFLPINCGAVSPTLIENELFGHERGAYTGADRRHRGYFEQTSGGTLFLDEILEMPLELQVKLLRVLESGQLLRVGGVESIPVDVRVIAATNKDPAAALEDGKLREDLYYRLKVFDIDLPPLRQRVDDIEPLCQLFLAQLNRRTDERKRLAPGTLEVMELYSWPGNVRELKNVIEHAYILGGRIITPDCLPVEVRLNLEPPLRGDSGLGMNVGDTIAAVERRLILATLKQAATRKDAAEMLGISVKTLYNRLRSYGMIESASH